jgi:hypothetical protein
MFWFLKRRPRQQEWDEIALKELHILYDRGYEGFLEQALRELNIDLSQPRPAFRDEWHETMYDVTIHIRCKELYRAEMDHIVSALVERRSREGETP